MPRQSMYDSYITPIEFSMIIFSTNKTDLLVPKLVLCISKMEKNYSQSYVSLPVSLIILYTALEHLFYEQLKLAF